MNHIFVNGDVFTSLSAMERLLNGEINAAAVVEEYVSVDQKRYDLLRT